MHPCASLHGILILNLAKFASAFFFGQKKQQVKHNHVNKARRRRGRSARRFRDVKSLAHESGTHFGDNGRRNGVHIYIERAHTSNVRPLRGETHTYTYVTNGGWNLLRDSDSRCLGSDFSDSSPGDICPMQEGTGSSSAKDVPPSSLSFVKESEARVCSSPPLISRPNDRVVTLRILRTSSASPRLITFILSMSPQTGLIRKITRYILWSFDGYTTRCCSRCKQIAKVKSILEDINRFIIHTECSRNCY